MALGEVDLGIKPALLPPIIQVIMVDHLVFIVMVRTEVYIYITPDFFAYDHGGINISHPRFPQEDIPRGVQG